MNCVHHWIIDSKGLGKCRLCNAERQFKNECPSHYSAEYSTNYLEHKQAMKGAGYGTTEGSLSLESLRRAEASQEERDYRNLWHDEGWEE